MKKLSIRDILAKKGKEKIVAITAYDALFTKLFDENVDLILIGDSLNMSFNGKKDTLDIDINAMLYHTRAVCGAARHAYVVADLPFGSYYDERGAIKSSLKLIKQGGADAVKLEGGAKKAHLVRALSDEGISVVGHIGLMPQSVRFEGGYLVKGRDEKQAQGLLADALALQEAGAVTIVLEGVISSVASEITNAIKIPTIGIGSGADTDGQILVFSDMLGLFDEFVPKFVKRYMNGADLVRKTIKNYADEVRSGAFPSSEYEYKK
ncbi:3-methyl-2-oxobutanoate hydroxymethyltransferase [Campylobacter sp. 19-13652]|uniref:3-methyl-2-oxobutanoate hydroxymethyltransferase n=1 Tax=Campylobacter sp. 19-13652 TaxID=2840180 RepID=UPI001C794D1F|nr:3-methyl-2-oxobutanoate hydroxymethyltransferase [Campylobacter sp. 19-13652]BCX79315.1 3-methyl-2-oxobutanoate hydroxymethyltransferase [Campylobacter sp. 19-13652]